MNILPPSKCNSSLKAPAALLSDKERFFLFNDVNLIGRSENAFICIKDSSISRKHCVIVKAEDKKFTICDTSASGTFVNNKRLVKNKVHELHHKDTISLSSPGKHSYSFYLNPKPSDGVRNISADQNEYFNFQMQEKILNLDHSHSLELKKLNQELYKIESDKSFLKEEMNSRLEAQENLFKAERLSYSDLVTSTKEQKETAERKLKDMEEKCKAEKNKLMKEVEMKLANITYKEEELQNVKSEMELKHQKDRKELEERCRKEIDQLKAKLATSEIKQDRLLEETRDAKHQLEESKKILLECEIEQTRLAEEMVEVETKLESKIIDLTKESTFKDDVVRDLERKLKERDEERERVMKEMEGLEEQLMCSICTELFIEPTVLNCGHMFCKKCIEEWKTKKKICPMCRAKVSGCVQVFNLDSIIEKNVALLSSEAKEHRENVINARKKAPGKYAKKKKHRATSPYRRGRQSPPQHMIPMVQIPDVTHLSNFTRTITYGDDVDIVDPFNWLAPPHGRNLLPRMVPSVEALGDGWMPMESDDSVAAIDLTNVVETPVQRTHTSTATSTSTGGLIDLTTP